jgi:hypothetical protein
VIVKVLVPPGKYFPTSPAGTAVSVAVTVQNPLVVEEV